MAFPSDISPLPVLDDGEERELAVRIEAGALAAAVLAGAQSAPPGHEPPRATAAELAMLAAEGRQAHVLFVRANLGLVGMVAGPAARASGLGFADLYQEGCLGLLVAVLRFDYERGRFATYALHWIRAYVGAATARSLGASNLPTSRAEQLRSARATERALAQQFGREPTTAELAEALGRSCSWTRGLLRYQPPEQLDALDVERLADADDPELVALFRAGRPGRELLGHLPPLERAVIEWRMGFTGGRAHTLQEIADRLGLTRARVRRVEQQALDRLRGVCPQAAIDQLTA